MTEARPRVAGGGWGQEIDNLFRGRTGGFLIGILLIDTMETWWIGETVSMLHALIFVGIAYVLNLAFVTVMGFRGRTPGARYSLTEALEATGLAVIAGAVTLTLLN